MRNLVLHFLGFIQKKLLVIFFLLLAFIEGEKNSDNNLEVETILKIHFV